MNDLYSDLKFLEATAALDFGSRPLSPVQRSFYPGALDTEEAPDVGAVPNMAEEEEKKEPEPPTP